MKRYKCVFNGKDKCQRLIISGLKLESMSQPISISTKEEAGDDTPRPSKRRSEVIEDEEGVEGKIYEMCDADNRVYISKRVDLSANYFAFVNVGPSLRVIPISEWQRFSLRNAYNEVLSDIVLPGLDIKEKEEEIEEIDYQDKFDDDNSEDEIQIRVEKKLSKAGKKMKSLMKTYEGEDLGLKTDDLRDILGKSRMTLKELINEVKGRVKLIDEKAKEMIRVFIKEECDIIEDTSNGKYISLRK